MLYFFFSQIRVDHFVPTSVLFVQQTRTQKQTGNVASAQNVCTRTALTRQFTQQAAIAGNNYTHIPALNYGFFFVFKNVRHLTVCNCIRNGKSGEKIMLPLAETKKQT